MPTIRLELAYDGSGFRGYARQPGLRTIQGLLEEALATILGGAPVETAVAGRTDAGVHARGQVVSFRTDVEPNTRQMLRSLNGILGQEIAIVTAEVVDQGFDARFSARWRRYRYLMSTGPVPDPVTRNHVWQVGGDLDLEAMQKTVAWFLGEQDFSAFCRLVEGKSNVRTVDESVLDVMPGELLAYWIRANAFCHQMVRSLVGLVYDVGRGFTSLSEVPDIIERRDRGPVVTVAPPHGLSLWEVGY
jgi:tRNA pseudouridine38-40 synthase